MYVDDLPVCYSDKRIQILQAKDRFHAFLPLEVATPRPYVDHERGILSRS